MAYGSVHKAQQAEKERCNFRYEVSAASTALKIKQYFNSCYTRLLERSNHCQKNLNNFLIHANPSSSQLILTGLVILPKSQNHQSRQDDLTR